MDPEPVPGKPHRRRPRYRGLHPRSFAEKYKELDPGKYPEDVAKVIAAGKTPAGMHLPIMVAEVLEALAPGPGMIGVDATIGHGGHARQLLEAIAPNGKLVGMDVDPIQLPLTTARLQADGFGVSQFLAVRSNFAGMPRVIAEIGKADFIFADLGCSSMQIDDPARGFTFKASGPLDMRMNPERGLPAGQWLATVSPEKLEMVLRGNADLENAFELAQVLAGHVWHNTIEFATAIRRVLGQNVSEEDAARCVRRVFQAVRIAVNDEFGALDALLRCLPDMLLPGGRVVILTFHSGEDRRVKHAFRTAIANGIYIDNNMPVIVAGEEERRANPRSIPAKLRWVRRA